MTPHSAIRTGCVLVAIAGSGCFSRSPYPLTWPAVPERAQRACEQLVGTYRDQGGNQLRGESLTQLLLGQTGWAWRPGSVTLSFPRVEQIQIDVSGSEEQSSSRTFTAEERRFVCQAGSVMLRRPAQWSLGGGLGLGRFSETMELLSVEDSLVVKRKQQTFILFAFMVPGVSRQTDWYRFERATRVPEGKTESTRVGAAGRLVKN